MTSNIRSSSASAIKIAGLVLIALLAMATLIGWSHFGSDILLDAASAGLSWCF